MRDPVCGMPGAIERHGHWFCSERCIVEFERRASSHAVWSRIRDPWLWVPMTGVALGTAGWWWPSASHASVIYLSYLRKVFLPFFIGLVLGGVIDHFVPRAYIVKLLSGPRKRVIVRSTLLGLPYGDQAIFVRREIFRRIGGFPDWPLMEDVALVERLRKVGPFVMLSEPAITSARRWEQEGLFATTARNLWLLASYILGRSPSSMRGR